MDLDGSVDHLFAYRILIHLSVFASWRENPRFAELCFQNGQSFIGAKDLAIPSGVNCLLSGNAYWSVDLPVCLWQSQTAATKTLRSLAGRFGQLLSNPTE
jgi:hypothetical protein